MPCSAYTCLDVCKKSFIYLQQFSRYLGKCRVAPFFLDHPVYTSGIYIYIYIYSLVGLACHVERPFIVTSCSRDSTLRVWSIARLVQPLEINILCSRPWKEIVISPGPLMFVRIFIHFSYFWQRIVFTLYLFFSLYVCFLSVCLSVCLSLSLQQQPAKMQFR